MPHSETFNAAIQIIASASNYTLGDFLMDLFCETERSERHGKMLGLFLRGKTTFGVGAVLQRLDTIVGRFKDPQEESYSLATSYDVLKLGHAAIISYTAQKVCQKLSAEQRAAVDPDGGLHVFTPHKKTDPINLRLSWDTYGATTFTDVQTLLVKHQPLTFNYLERLAIPERHDLTKGFRYRPPNFVRENLLS